MSLPKGFSWALEQMAYGYAVYRLGWNNPGRSIRIEAGKEHLIPIGPMTKVAKLSSYVDYIKATDPDQGVIAYIPSNSDINTDDWRLVT